MTTPVCDTPIMPTSPAEGSLPIITTLTKSWLSGTGVRVGPQTCPHLWTVCCFAETKTKNVDPALAHRHDRHRCRCRSHLGQERPRHSLQTPTQTIIVGTCEPGYRYVIQPNVCMYSVSP
jgi:hypothetical protein